MECKTRAIVLRALKYGESQMIVDMLSRERGRLTFICHLPKTQKGRVRKQYFQPMTILDVVLDYREQAHFQHFRDLRLAEAYTSIPFDARKLAIVQFLAEFMVYATRDEQDSREMEEYVERSLEWLDAATGQFANFHLVFTMHLSRFIGFFPNLTDYSPGAWFDLRGGVFTLIRPSHGDYLKPEEASHIRTLMRMDYDNMHLFRLTRTERNRCLEIILWYYRLHVPSFPELRSLDVLRTLF